MKGIERKVGLPLKAQKEILDKGKGAFLVVFKAWTNSTELGLWKISICNFKKRGL